MNRQFLTLFSVLILAAVSTSFAEERTDTSRAAELGQQAAQADLRAGKLAVESYGLMAPFSGNYRKLLKERYGIEIHSVAGCLVNREITDHAQGYNRVMNAEISKRFGDDVFTKTATEAQEIYRKEVKN